MGFSETLRERAAPIWERIFDHPFVVGLGDGTLPTEKFRFYVAQDYVYLIEYAKVFALAVTKAADLETMGKFAELVHSTLNIEMALHRRYAAKFGLTLEDLENTQAAPTTYAYTRHHLTLAYGGTLPQLVAAILPCQWGYAEIGQRLAQKPPAEPLYAEWINTYTSAEFVALANWLRSLLNKLAGGMSSADLDRVERCYQTSCRYEYLFWEMAYRQEEWPL